LHEDDVVNFIKQSLPKLLVHFAHAQFADEQLHLIAKLGNGDLRNALNLLEAVLSLKTD
jgi:replication-associated recombination protein RarA